VYATSHLSFVAFYSYLVSWLAMIWACAYYTDFADGWFLRELCIKECKDCWNQEMCIFPCSWLVNVWNDEKWCITWPTKIPNMEKMRQRQMTSCVHKKCGRTYGHLVYATSHLSFVAFYSYLVSWLAMIWACAYYTDFTDGWFLGEL
jgi:hypothetical protein